MGGHLRYTDGPPGGRTDDRGGMLVPTPLPVATAETAFESTVPSYQMRVQEEALKMRLILIRAAVVGGIFLLLVVMILLLAGQGSRGGGKRSNGPEPAKTVEHVSNLLVAGKLKTCPTGF